MLTWTRYSLLVDEVRDLNLLPAGEDCTGDSGIGTWSGSDQYGGLEEWKNAMQDPPPESEHSYQPLMGASTEGTCIHTTHSQIYGALSVA